MSQKNNYEKNNLEKMCNYFDNDLKIVSLLEFIPNNNTNSFSNEEIKCKNLSPKVFNILKEKKLKTNNNNFLYFNKEEEIKNKFINNEEDCNLIKKRKKSKRFRIHNDLQFDNIRSNIKNKFFNFIIVFFNGLINHLYGNGFVNFKKINYYEKKKITRQELSEQFKMTMKDILELDIQSNYTKHQKEYNKNELKKLLYQIQNNYNDASKVISYFLNMLLSDFYSQIFIVGKREELKLKYDLPENAYLLNEIINNLKKKSDKYKYLYKITALNLIYFSRIKKNENLEKSKIINNNDRIDKEDFFDITNENNFTIKSFELFNENYEPKLLNKNSKEDFEKFFL